MSQGGEIKSFFSIKPKVYQKKEAVKLRIDGIHTSTIGSFPLEDSPESRARCMDDMIRVGIDLPNYPQLIEMGEQFLEDLITWGTGIVKRGSRYWLEGEKIEKAQLPPGLEPYLWTVKYLKERGLLGRIKLKACITGPFTLASYINIKEGFFPYNTAISDAERIRELVEILAMACERMSNSASVISIDEPLLGVVVGRSIPFSYDGEFIIKVYNRLKGACGDSFVGTHICGRISPLLADILLETELDFISHEFHDTQSNFNVYDPERFRDSGKVMAVGCVSTKNPKIESVDEILNIARRAMERFGRDLILTPDCGFRNMIVEGSREKGYTISVRKLVNLVKASSKLKG